MLIDDLLVTKEGMEQLRTYCKNKGREGIESIGHAAGATACVALIANNQIIVANAGDSRCVLSVNLKAVELSIDHKPDLPTEILRIE